MFYAPGLLYIHIPRTGGSFITSLLEAQHVGTRSVGPEIDGHDSVRSVPTQILERSLVFATVRDPWSWYVSIDAHYRHKSSMDGFLLDYFGGRQVSKKEAILGMTRPSSLSFVGMQKAVKPPGMRRPYPALATQLESTGVGLWTWMILHLLCAEEFETLPGLNSALRGLSLSSVPWGVNALVDTAQVREGLSCVVSAWDAERGEQMAPRIASESPKNGTAGFQGVLPTAKPDPGHYDQQLIETILSVDGPMMRMLGFDHPIGSGVRPAVRIVGG